MKGKRLIIVLLTLLSNKTRDYHKDMNAEVFEAMLKYVSAGSVVVMDNTSYHSRRVKKTPTSSSRKQKIVDWLTSKDITFQANIIRKELQSIINPSKHHFMKYAVEVIAEKYIIVLRLPQYHCELNPIELIWAQVNRYLARRNVTFKMKDTFEQTVNEITPENSRKFLFLRRRKNVEF